MQHTAGAVGQADAVSLRIKARLAAESVAGERHAADICAFRKRLHHLPCRAAGRGFAGGKIRLPAGFDPAHRFFQKISVARNVRRQEGIQRHLGFLGRAEQLGKPFAAVAHVEGQQSGLAAQHAAPAHCRGQAQQFFISDFGTAMVGKGNFCADHAINQHEIPFHAAAQRRGGIAVGAGEHPAVNAFFRQGADLGIKRFQAARHAVRAQQTDQCRDPGGGKIRQPGFRRTGGKAIFSAAARDMDVQINETGGKNLCLRINHAQGREGLRNGAARSDERDLSAFQQQILQPQVFRGVDICVFNQCQHFWLLSFVGKFSAHKAGYVQLLFQNPIERRPHLQRNAGGEHVD